MKKVGKGGWFFCSMYWYRCRPGLIWLIEPEISVNICSEKKSWKWEINFRLPYLHELAIDIITGVGKEVTAGQGRHHEDFRKAYSSENLTGRKLPLRNF